MIRYTGSSIVMQEVPDEVSLAINITGCQVRCSDCHSKFLWDVNNGIPLEQDFDTLLKKYDKYITCVCFMGGDHLQNELIGFLKKAKSNGLKTCLYTGKKAYEIQKDVIDLLDYLKVGAYIESYGGLASTTTNQRMYKIDQDGKFTDITYKFQEVKI